MSLSEAINYLAIHLYKVLSKEKANVFFSPFSISVAMGMLLCGAEGETATELRAALGHEFAGIKKEDVASIFEQLISNIHQHNDSYTLSVANSMLSQKCFPVKDEYKAIISDFFKALILEVDFKGDNKNVLNKINKWVKEKTNNKIPKFVKTLHPNTLLVLLNAIYFKGSWMQKFDKKYTKSKKFYNYGMENKAIKVDMMYMTDSFPFYKERDHLGLLLPYVGEEIAMVFLLPYEKNGLDSLEATLSPSYFQEFKTKFRKTRVRVEIPRFHLEYEKELVSSFQELGVRRVFCDAELTNLTDERGLFVNGVLHKAVLDVNEEGSEAAAVTMFPVPKSAPPSFLVDHPFMFLIYSLKNDLILFMGRVNKL